MFPWSGENFIVQLDKPYPKKGEIVNKSNRVICFNWNSTEFRTKTTYLTLNILCLCWIWFKIGWKAIAKHCKTLYFIFIHIYTTPRLFCTLVCKMNVRMLQRKIVKWHLNLLSLYCIFMSEFRDLHPTIYETFPKPTFDMHTYFMHWFASFVGLVSHFPYNYVSFHAYSRVEQCPVIPTTKPFSHVSPPRHWVFAVWNSYKHLLTLC